MIDDKQLLWDRLKDTAELSLRVDIEEIGQVFDKHKQEINTMLYDYISWALTRYSTTEIRRVFASLAEHHKGLENIIDYEKINKLDEWLELDQAFSLHTRMNFRNHIKKMAQHPLMNHNIGKSSGTSHLKDLVRKLKNESDPRRMRRLKRKETKLKKKGIRLFDSEA